MILVPDCYFPSHIKLIAQEDKNFSLRSISYPAFFLLPISFRSNASHPPQTPKLCISPPFRRKEGEAKGS